MQVKETVMMKIGDLNPYDSNPRIHLQEQIDQVAKSIEEFGWTMPVLIDEDCMIIAGHGRVMAGQKLGIKEVPCIVARGWTEEQKKAYCIADNKLTENSRWDKDLLKLNLESLQDGNFDLSTTGFDLEELSEFLTDINSIGLTEDDAVPEEEEAEVSQIGNIWALDDHRIMCGDSTNLEHISLLMNSNKADMVLTDPPYNVDYGKAKGNEANNYRFKERPIQNDAMSDEDFYNFLVKFIENAKTVVKSGSPFYISYGERNALRFLKAFEDAGLYHSCNIIWKKHTLVLGRSDYHYIHEPIFYGWIQDGKHNYYGDRKQTSVWEVARPMSSDLHPTMKPIALLSIAINNSTKSGDIVLDCFGGSGSTLIACEKNKRVNYSLELEPKYCDVMIRRWQEYTGKSAVLLETGEEFNSKCAS
jgi:DNA modification methylase